MAKAKQYRIGTINADGTCAVEVADMDGDNWHVHETCESVQAAGELAQALTTAEHERIGYVPPIGVDFETAVSQLLKARPEQSKK